MPNAHEKRTMMLTPFPHDFTEALKKAGLADFFAGCTGPHQHEYLKWIGEAKKPETRQKRIVRVMEMLSAKCAEEAKRAKKKR